MAKAVLRGKFIEMCTSIKELERHQINYLTMYLKDLKHIKPQISSRKEISKVTEKINKTEINHMKNQWNKGLIFKNKQNDVQLAQKKHEQEKTQINKNQRWKMGCYNEYHRNQKNHQ